MYLDAILPGHRSTRVDGSKGNCHDPLINITTYIKMGWFVVLKLVD